MLAVRQCLRLLATVLLLLGAATPVVAANKGQVALVVGIGAYQNAPALPNPPKDARAIAESLKKIGFEVELAIDPDKTRLEQAVKRFGDQLQGAKVGLFFYAGHGLQVNGRNFLIPADAKIDNERSLPFSAVDADLVLTQMETSTPVSLIFLDACRDNPFSRSLARSMGTRSAAVGRGLAQIAAGEGSLIVFATQPGNVAEDGKADHSPFTEALLKNLAAPGLEVRQMLTRVRQQVKEQTNGKQVPWDHSSLTQDYYFIGPTTVIVQPPPASSAEPKTVGVDPMAVQLSLWESVRTSQDPADFEDYLKQYPDGKFAAIARRRLAALKAASLKERQPARPETEVAPASPTPAVERQPTKPSPAPQPPIVKPSPETVAAFDVMMLGTATNLTVGTTAQVQFQLRRSGDSVTAAIRVLPPLFATGVLQGQYQGGQCLMQGWMNEGFLLKMVGACSASSFSGQYQAESPGLVQQGVFRLQARRTN
ncbi:caspase domain-containing protein [Accumulibacter sp.]|uniref:caspase family protein n=1 Tax=Accumulibacter sp. TaxID=2053492 RepID=UPI00260CCEEC|nr:caspase domain-containing protein [Accumulibacter sp.]